MPFVYSCHHAAARFVLNHPDQLVAAIFDVDNRLRPALAPADMVAREVSRLLGSSTPHVPPKLWAAILKVIKDSEAEFAQCLPLAADVDLVISLIERSSND
ncbi:hypothetical protein [Aeromonas phage Asp37]|nr:hypothetical protein [Aeromonas phage Asp37]